MITHLSCLEGDWEAGLEYSDRCLEVSPLEPTLLGTRAMLEHETGETAQGEVYLERLLEVPLAESDVLLHLPALYRENAHLLIPTQNNPVIEVYQAEYGKFLVVVTRYFKAERVAQR